MSTPGQADVPVWDPFIRLFHWLLVIGFVSAYLTRHASGPWHEWLGYAVAALLVARLAWGLLGPRYARFSQFVRSPRTTLRYSSQMIRGYQPRYLGHNPLGGWMVVVQGITLTVICFSGWLYTTKTFWGVEWVERVHDISTWVSLALIALHIAGVAFTSWRHRENLVSSMVHGKKRPAREGDIA